MNMHKIPVLPGLSKQFKQSYVTSLEETEIVEIFTPPFFSRSFFSKIKTFFAVNSELTTSADSDMNIIAYYDYDDNTICNSKKYESLAK